MIGKLRFLKKAHALRHSEDGVALLEAALIMPLALSLMAGAVDFGMAFTKLATAQKSLRDSARYLAGLPSTNVCSSWAETNVKNLAIFGNTAGTGSARISGWTTSNITVKVYQNSVTFVTLPASCPATVSFVQVNATVPYTSIVLPAIGLPSAFTMTAQHQERWIGQ